VQQNEQWKNAEKNGNRGKKEISFSRRKLEIYIRWFRLIKHEVTGQDVWISNEKYWHRNWANCPDIY
jgi:hypothetical protein